MTESEDRIQDAQSTKRSLTELEDELDRLWAKYLDHLDHYQSAMIALSKHLSTGFFSLARANMRSPGKRLYGQDFYDQRMKASRHYHVTISLEDRLKVESSDVIALGSLKLDEKDNQEEPKQQPSPPATPPPGEDENAAQDSSGPSAQLPSDPLRWFGILLPQEIRNTQAAFVQAVENPTVDAANSSRDLRQLEAEIRKLRKTIKKAAAAAA